MARFHYLILSRAKPGQEAEYIRWYKEQHLVDVARVPGVVSATLLQSDFQKVYDLDAPVYTLLTMYELETDEPEALVQSIRETSGSNEMPMTETIDKAGMIQLIAHKIASA